VSEQPAAWFAQLYKLDGLKGGHVILLGPGNESQAIDCLAAYPGGLQLGGGVNLTNARSWLEAGASHVVLTSWVFQAGRLDRDRLKLLVGSIGRDRLVLDLSCRRRDGRYYVVTDRWQRFTELVIGPETLLDLSHFCAEFLVHAVDVEGLCSGIDEELVQNLGLWSPIPCTYAGGAKTINDLDQVTVLSKGRVDLTIGSALDIFGGSGIRYDEAVAFNRNFSQPRPTTP
jgi:phosphoribosylformimino-5-aminoimidazole carboxamide ribotide isomerase